MNRTAHLSTLTMLAALGMAAIPAAHAQTPPPVLTATTLDFVGVTPAHVGYDANTPTSNFGNPSQTNASVAYDVYFRSDSNYVYALLESLPSSANNNDPGPNFENAYLGTVANTRNIGFSINGDNKTDSAFTPGGATGYDLSSTGFTLVTGKAADGGNIIEWAMPWTYFTTDPLNMGFAKVQPGGVLSFGRSQSYGYSYVSGPVNTPSNDPLAQTTYTPAAAPEPSQFAAFAIGLLGLGALVLKAKKRQNA